MVYDEEVGELRWINPGRNKKHLVGKISGRLQKATGRRQTKINRKQYYNSRLIWLYHYGYFPENIVDHIDRNPQNNRIENLREVSCVCNVRNSTLKSKGISGVRGVYWAKAHKKWAARVKNNNQQICIGFFDDLVEAVAHRLAVEQSLNWSGCDSSSPSYLYIKEYLNGR